MKASHKMRKAIERYTKRFPDAIVSYDVEFCESNRVGRGFYDFAIISVPGFPNLTRIATHDGRLFR